MRELKGKVAVVTGAASGIGASLARQLAQRGAKLALLDLDAPRLEQLAQQLRAKHEGVQREAFDVSTCAVDVSRPEAIEAARAQILARHGRVDLLINNAGVTTFAPFAAMSRPQMQRLVDINLWGVIEGCRIFLPDLRQHPGAHIVNIASEAGVLGFPWQSIYCATKFAVRGFSASIRAELSSNQIGVTCVLPGATATNIMSSAPSSDPSSSQALASLLLKYAPSPDRVANRIVKAVRRNKAELFTGPDSWLVDWGARFAPGLTRFTMARLAKQAAMRVGEPSLPEHGEKPADDKADCS